jgi:hypothetical protein
LADQGVRLFNTAKGELTIMFKWIKEDLKNGIRVSTQDLMDGIQQTSVRLTLDIVMNGSEKITDVRSIADSIAKILANKLSKRYLAITDNSHNCCYTNEITVSYNANDHVPPEKSVQDPVKMLDTGSLIDIDWWWHEEDNTRSTPNVDPDFPY